MADGEYLKIQDAVGRTPESGPPVPKEKPVKKPLSIGRLWAKAVRAAKQNKRKGK